MTNLYKALLKAQTEMGSVKKDEKNPFFKSSYASLNAVRETVIPVLNSNGIVLTQPTVVLEGKQYVQTNLTHAESGESFYSVTEVLTKTAGDAQQAGSGISYARRYGLMSILCLAAEDDDAESSVGRGKGQSKQEAKAATNDVTSNPSATKASYSFKVPKSNGAVTAQAPTTLPSNDSGSWE